MSIRTMKQVLIKKVNVSSGVVHKQSGQILDSSKIQLNENGSIKLKGTCETVAISESIFTRTFEESLENFIIFKFLGINGYMQSYEKEIIEQIFDEGILVEGKCYKPFIQSSSQNRSNEVIFTSVENRVAALSELMAIDLNSHSKFKMSPNQGEKVVINKFMSRAGMTLAGGLATGVLLTKSNYTAIKDLESELKVQGDVYDYNLDHNELFKMNKEIHHKVTDGQNYMSMIKAAEIARGIGLIETCNFHYFYNHWKGMASLEGDVRLKEIFNSFYKVMQLRAPGIKGLFIAIDFYTLRNQFDVDIMEGHLPMSNDIHFIVGEGGLKYVPDHAVELQFMQGNKDKRLASTLSMQTLNSLNLSIEDANILAERTIEMFNRVLTDVDYALEFLGSYFPTDLNAESIDEVLVTKVHKALMANPDTIKEAWVKKALARKLLGKKNSDGQLIEVGALQRAKYGKLPIKGNFFFVITDPYAHLGLGTRLKSGEIYFNNHEQQVSLFRYPNIHESEIVKADSVKVQDYDYLENVIITNPVDDTLPRMAGGDTDGDLLLIVFDQVIVNNTPDYHQVLPYGEGAKSQQSDLTFEAYENKLMASIFDDSKIGQITNNATIFRGFENSLNLKGKKSELATAYHKKVFELRFLQGYEIDKAKTGVKVEISDELEPKFIPTWFMRYLYEVKGVSADYLKETYSSQKDWDLVIDSESALAHIYRTFRDYEEELKKRISNINKGSFLKGFVSSIVSHEAFNAKDAESIYLEIKGLEKDYRKEMSLALDHKDAATSNYHSSLVFTKYQAFMDAIKANDITKLYASYTVVMNRDNQSDSFYRSFCFDALLKIYEEMASRKTVLVKVDDMVEKVTVRGGKVYFDGQLTNESYEILKGKRVSYKTFTLESGRYIRASLKKDIAISECLTAKEPEVSMALTVLGLQYNALQGKTVNDVKCILADSTLTLNSINYNNEFRIALFADDVLVGMLPATRNRYAKQYLGYQLTYLNSILSETKDGFAKTLELEFLFESKIVEVNPIQREIEKVENEVVKMYDHLPTLQELLEKKEHIKGTIR